MLGTSDLHHRSDFDQGWFWIRLNLHIALQCVVKQGISAHCGNTGCRVFKWGIQNWKYFCLKINITKGNYWILTIGVVASCQKLGIILVIKWFKNWCYQKCAPKLVFFNKKKLRKIWRIFDIEIDFESKILALFDIPTTPIQ